MGVGGGNPGLEKRSWREAGERIRRGGRRRARLGALAGVGGVGVVLGDGRNDGQRALTTGLRRLRHWLSKVEKASALGGPCLVTWPPSLPWMFPSPQHPHWLTPPPAPRGGSLRSLESWMGANSLSWRGGSCFTWGRGSAFSPLSLFLWSLGYPQVGAFLYIESPQRMTRRVCGGHARGFFSDLSFSKDSINSCIAVARVEQL